MTDGNKSCPHCGEEIRLSASLCRFCQRPVERATLQIDWVRDPAETKVGGVASMLARASGISVTLVRLGFVVFGVFNIPLAVTAYALLWICTPTRGGLSAADSAMNEAEELLFGRFADAFSGVTGRPPRQPAATEPDEVHARAPAAAAPRPVDGPVAAGPGPVETKRSRYDADEDEWPRRS